ncbi:cytochrome P450 [Planobispora rosea]|uniref:Cytochrome P450 n=1 Tax=Planobispora rosea TaxID=35762 RepID=A0A8J3WCE7_PLARO|nr:cytochrome P450 [Planobispora rosea]GGS49161.1 cytochrome P450 [Planobispora rosea]GIH83762.1 cytochrome P450 [Planobispora rosea]
MTTEIDIYHPSLYEIGVPWDRYARLRENSPVHRHAEPGGPGFWAVTRHADIQHVSRHPEVFSSYAGGIMVPDPTEEQLSRNRLMMLFQDPPEHTATRGIVNRGFTPRMIGKLEEHIREICHGLVGAALERGSADFVADIAAPLPLYVICELLGAPPEDREKIFTWSNALIGADDPEFATGDLTPIFELLNYASALGAQRRAEPRDDIVSKLVAPGEDGTSMDDLSLGVFVMLLAVAGNETTRNAASGGLQAFFDHPDQWRRLLDDRSLLRTLPDEVVRWVSPVITMRRTTLTDTELGGQKIPAGEKVVLYYPSGNRDADVFPDADTFDIGRDPNPHIGFGGGGPHFCLGAHLARMEVRVLFEVLAERAPDIAPAGRVRRLRSNFVNSIKEMPVRLDG